MRLIPVMDLLDGRVVQAIKGEREQYKPVKSVLCDTSEPVDVARAFRDQLGLSEIYIADLDAIMGRGSHRETPLRKRPTGSQMLFPNGMRVNVRKLAVVGCCEAGGS